MSTEWSCQADTAQLSVGTEFSLNCNGTAQPLDHAKVMIMDAAKDGLRLKLLDIKALDDQHIQAVATSYRVGELSSNQKLVLTDGQTEIALSGLNMQVSSVIEQNTKPEPYPAFPAWSVGIPMWFWLSIAFVLGCSGFAGWRYLKRRREYRELIKEVEKLKTLRLPFDEFHREIRQVERRFGTNPQNLQEYLKEIEHTFRLFLVREFVVPALQWSDRSVLKQIRRMQTLEIKTFERLKQHLEEFSRLKHHDVKFEELQQVLEMSRQLADQIEKERSKQRGRK